MSSSSTNNSGGKLQELIEKWGAKSAMLLLCLCAWIYQQDRSQMTNDNQALEARLMTENKSLSSRTAANERAIGRLQEGKASREELKAAMDQITRDNQRGRDDFKDTIQVLRNDLVQRMDIITATKR